MREDGATHAGPPARGAVAEVSEDTGCVSQSPLGVEVEGKAQSRRPPDPAAGAQRRRLLPPRRNGCDGGGAERHAYIGLLLHAEGSKPYGDRRLELRASKAEKMAREAAQCAQQLQQTTLHLQGQLQTEEADKGRLQKQLQTQEAEKEELKQRVIALYTDNETSLEFLSECEAAVVELAQEIDRYQEVERRLRSERQARIELEREYRSAVEYFGEVERELQEERVTRAAAEEATRREAQRAAREKEEGSRALRAATRREEEVRKSAAKTEVELRKCKRDTKGLMEQYRSQIREHEEERSVLLLRLRQLETQRTQQRRPPFSDGDERLRDAVEKCSKHGIEAIDEEAATILSTSISSIRVHDAWRMLRLKKGSAGARDEAKKLMTKLHPDKVSIDAAKETLRKRFQVLNHIRGLLPAE
eukprot:Hpha_TRINITY_DN11570_c0_g1::TRINITY_DN11570_c0_g1_i1::g.32377::m.32377